MEKIHKSFAPQDLNSVLGLLQAKLNVSDKKIDTPFETKIDPDTITAESLRQLARSKIELLLRKNLAGEFIFSTGKRNSVEYGYPEGSISEKPLIPSNYPNIDEFMDSINSEKAIIESLMSLQEEVRTASSTAHNHPSIELMDIITSGKNLCAPSPGDIRISRNTVSKNDFIISEFGICKFKTPSNLSDEELEKIDQMSRSDFSEYVRHLTNLGIVKEVARFSDPEIQGLIEEFKNS